MATNMTKLEAVNEMLEAIDVYPVAALDTGGTSEAAQAERVLDRENKRIQARGWHCNTEDKEDESDGVEIDISDTQLTVVLDTGTFLAGEIVTGNDSGATGRFGYLVGTTVMMLETLTGTFTTSDNTLSGGTSGAVIQTCSAVATVTTSHIVVDSDILAADSYGQSASRDVVLRNGKLYDRKNNTYDHTEAIRVKQIRLITFAQLPIDLQYLIAADAKKIFQRRQVGNKDSDAFLRDEESIARGRARHEDANVADYNILTTDHARRMLGVTNVIHTGR